MESRTAHSSPEDAVSALLQERGDDGSILTGWVLSATMKHPTLPGGDGYVTISSEGLPYHSQLGLLQAALDDRRNTLLVNILEGRDSDG